MYVKKLHRKQKPRNLPRNKTVTNCRVASKLKTKIMNLVKKVHFKNIVSLVYFYERPRKKTFFFL